MERKPISVKLALGNTAACGRIDSGSPPTSVCAVIRQEQWPKPVRPVSFREGVTPQMTLGFGTTCIQFDCAERQFITTVMAASVDVSLIIKKRLSGAMSQLIGPVRIPVSTMTVWNNRCGLPHLNTDVVVTSTAIIWESGEM